MAERTSKHSNESPLPFPLKRIFVDTGIMKPSGRELSLAVSAFGADRILFGSDFPQFGAHQPRTAFQNSGLDGDIQRMILLENGSKLLSRKV